MIAVLIGWLVLSTGFGGETVLAQQRADLAGMIARSRGGRPLVDNTSLKIGAAYSESFVKVVRNSDQSEATLISDSDVSPYLSFASPPLFLFGSNLAVGISATYSKFTSSQQNFPGQGPASLGSRVEVEMLTVTPDISLYIGKNSATQFLRISVGQGIGYADLKGEVQFGDTPGAESTERVGSPSGATPAVSFSVEYRLGFLSLAYFGGGPKIETPQHTYTLGEDTFVLAIVINI